jgi:ABC-type branched-subunit amino acid transport system substrate-binding protein
MQRRWRAASEHVGRVKGSPCPHTKPCRTRSSTGVDYYLNTLDNPVNKKLVEDYRAKWDGEYPNLNAWGGWFAVNLFLEGVKKTGGDTTPAKLVEAMSDLTIDTPGGPVAMSAYKDAFIGTTNLYIGEVQKGPDRYQWVTIKTFEGVRNIDVSDM